MVAALERILLTLWVGALWAVGYIAAPVLFGILDDRTLAGQLAGGMFTRVAMLSMVAGSSLLLAQLLRRRPLWRSVVVVIMLMLIAVGEFGVRAVIARSAEPERGRPHASVHLLHPPRTQLG